MRGYEYEYVHLRSPDPDTTAQFFEMMFAAAQRLSARHALSWTAAHYDAVRWPNSADRAAAPA